METYKIVFYRNEKIMNVWKGFHSITEARRKHQAITSVIPIDITVKIERDYK